jgi:hypothetical protein
LKQKQPVHVSNKRNHPLGHIGVLIAVFIGITPVLAAPPDLTSGGTIPSTLTTTWNLGPTGMRGWVYYDTTSGGINGSVESRQIQVRSVDAGSPAAGVFQANDLILGASGTAAAPVLFAIDARRALAAAIADAEARTPANLQLIRWRAGTQSVVTLTLRTMGAYSATAPYNCPKSEKILREGMSYYYNSETSGRYRMGVMSLLAAQDSFFPAQDRANYLQKAQTEARALIKSSTELNALRNYTASTAYSAPWGRVHELILLGEYFLITGDAQVFPTIEALAINLAKGASHFGTVAHSLRQGSYDPSQSFRTVNTGYGVVNSIGMPCLLGVQLAKRCGVSDPVVDDMIDRAKMFYASYAGRGSIPYGEHEAYDSRHENNGKNALAAILLDNDPVYENQAGIFAMMALASGDTDRDVGHTGAYFNYLWTPLGVQRGGPAAVQEYFKKISWMLDLHRRWNGGFAYDSYSENRAPNGSQYYDFRMSTAMLLTYALPLESLHITGRDSTGALALSAGQISDSVAVEDYVATSRTTAQLLADLANWSPKIRLLATAELGKRAIDTTTRDEIRAKALDVNGNSRYGAIQALGKINDTGFTAQLVSLLNDNDGYVRTLAAKALQGFSSSSKVPYRTSMMTTLVSRDRPTFPVDPNDPLQFDQAALISAIFGSGAFVNNRAEMDTLISQVGSQLFFDALKVASRHPAGAARGRITNLYKVLTPAEVNLMAPELVDMVALGSDADRMFSLDVRNEALKAMARSLVADAVPAAMQAIDGSNGWGGFHENLLNALVAYHGSSTLVTPDPNVVAFAQRYRTGGTIEEAQALLDAIAADTNPTPPFSFKNIASATADHPNVDTTTNTTTLRVTATDLAGGDSIFTWTKLSGPGSVTFTPNGTGTTASTLVFGGTPGTYQFRVTMSDSRGFTEDDETVSVTLIDSGGQDVIPPYLDPAIWSNAPAPVGGFSITMTAMTATDPSGVEYYFACTSGGGHDSGWQDSPTYTDTGLTHSTTYGYQVKVRDKSPLQNETALFTPTAFATTEFVAIDPLAVPGGPYTVLYGGALALNGSASIPSEGQSITSYEWDLDGDGSFDVSITGATPAAVSYAALTGYGMAEGANTIKLRVTDTAGKTSTVEGTVNLGGPMVIYEPFADSDPILGTNTSGWGLSGTWTAQSSWAVDSGSIPWGALKYSGNQVRATSGGTGGNAFVSPGTTLTSSGLLEHGNKLWFSMLYTTTPSVSGNPDAGFALGSAALDGGNNIPMTSSGNGIGFTIKGGALRATTWSAGTAARNTSGTTATDSEPVAGSTTYLVVGEIIWGGNGAAADTINLYFPNKNLALGPVVATRSATLDQSAFGVISYAHKNDSTPSYFDEIRFGANYASVVPANTDPLTLEPSGFVDNKSGGPVLESDTLVYTVSFNKVVDPATIDATDFENGGTSPITFNNVAVSGTKVFVTVTPTFPGAAGTLQLGVKAGAVIQDYLGNALDTSAPISDDTLITVNADTVPPQVVSINSPPAGTPIYGLPTIPFSVTFDKYFIDDATVTNADFTNAGTASITVGTVTRTSSGTNPAVYSFNVTPTSTGTLQLRLSGTVGDVMGNSATVPVNDDTILNFVSPVPRGTITVSDPVTSNATTAPHTLTFNAGGSDKLVVILTGENSNPGHLGDCTAVTYDGTPLIKAVERNAVPGTGANPATSSTDQLWHDIWYLDNPASSTGLINATVTSRAVITAFKLSGTVPGVGSTAVSGPASKSVSLIGSAAGSIILASHGMGGDGNTANTGSVDTISPLIETSALNQGSSWNGHVTGRMPVGSPGLLTPTFTGGNLSGTHTIAAEFLAAEAAGSPYTTWASTNAPTTGNDPSADEDNDGVDNAIEFVLGGTITTNDLDKLPAVGTSGGNLTFNFERNQDSIDASVAVSIEVGTDLANWPTIYPVPDTATAGPAVAVVDNADGTDTVTLNVAQAPGTKKFARLKVVITP